MSQSLHNLSLAMSNVAILLLIWPICWLVEPKFATSGTGAAGPQLYLYAEAVNVQRLNVPDLVVLDQMNQPQQSRSLDTQAGSSTTRHTMHGSNPGSSNNQPEAASLINSQDLSSSSDQQQQLNQITFECLISYDRKKERNLIIKWHHDDRNEPIYQWIPELNKRSIAPQYRAYIAPIVSSQQQQAPISSEQSAIQNSSNSTGGSNQIQLLEAGFRLIRPTKELGGKYTCSAISTQNDDSKWKKMIVYTPPRSFRFNASRTDIGAQLASQRERLIQLSQPPISMAAYQQQQASASGFNQQQQQLPPAYRMKGIESLLISQPTTISPQMYSTIDYVNVNQQRSRQSIQSASASTSWHTSPPTQSPVSAAMSQAAAAAIDSIRKQPLPAQTRPNRQPTPQQHNGVKLVCDIDQVFPVPEVSIYRVAKLDGSHPDKLAKLDTKIERDHLSGLYHVQVISILDDDELQMKYGLNEPVYFECLIALTNLELSKYADNKRSIVYRPGLLTSSSLQTSEDIKFEQIPSSSASGLSAYACNLLLRFILIFIHFGLLYSLSNCYLTLRV